MKKAVEHDPALVAELQERNATASLGVRTGRDAKRYGASPEAPEPNKFGGPSRRVGRPKSGSTRDLKRVYDMEVQVPRLDKQAWWRAERENLWPFPHWLFGTEGGMRALRLLDAWGQTLRLRRAFGDASLSPRPDVKTSADGGYSLPSSALDAATIENWLKDQPAWLSMLLETVFVDGWDMIRRDTAYMTPDPLREEEIASWRKVIAECEPEPFALWICGRFQTIGGFCWLKKSARMALAGILAIGPAYLEWLEEMRERENVAMNARRQARKLEEELIIIRRSDESAPARALAKREMLIRMWTFDLGQIAWTSKMFTMPHAKRQSAVELQLVMAVDSIATHLTGGKTFPAAVGDEKWVEIGWVGGGAEWR